MLSRTALLGLGDWARAGIAGRARWRGSGEDLRLAAFVVLVPATLTAAWWTLTSSQLANPELRAIYLVYDIAAPTLVGLVWWQQRPASRVGPLLVALGLLAWPLAWQARDDPLLSTFGIAAEGLPAFLIVYLCLAYPTGRLKLRADRVLAAVWAVLLAIAWLPIVLMPQVRGPLSAGTLSVGAVELLGVDVVTAMVATTAITLAAIVVRYRRSSPLQRLERQPIVMIALLVLPGLTAYYVVRGVWPVEPELGALTWAFVAGQFLLPLGFLVALVRSDLHAARATRSLVRQLGSDTPPEAASGLIASTIGDPGLRYAGWDAGLGTYLGVDGVALDERDVKAGQAWLPIERNGEAVAVMIADELLAIDAPLREAAATAAMLAVQEERKRQEQMALRAAAVTAVDAERQRIARNLHDSAQQRLVALRIQLSMLSDDAQHLSDNAALTAHLQEELDHSIEELRILARRALPPSSIGNGVAAALRSLAVGQPISVTVSERDFGRYPADIEMAIFNCCVDAVQNAAENAGPDASVSVRLLERSGVVRFVVRDDGRGFDPAVTQPGIGLRTMADRMALIGGCLNVWSEPGRGAVVTGTVHLADAAG